MRTRPAPLSRRPIFLPGYTRPSTIRWLGVETWAQMAYVIGIWLLCCTSAVAEELVNNPHYGPYSQSIANVATWNIKPGYLSLDPGETSAFLEKMHNPGVENCWLYGPEGLSPWFAVLSHEETGHVTDDEKLDPDAIMDQIKAATAESNQERRNRGWEELNIIGWQNPPHYESDTNRLSWAVLNESVRQRGVNYTTKILGRTGVVTVVLVTDPDHLDSAVSVLKSNLSDFSFNAGNTYAEFRDGDKVASYGLTGLIVGAAAAAAVKSGAWKWFSAILLAGWKAILAALLGIGAGIQAMASKKSEQGKS